MHAALLTLCLALGFIFSLVEAAIGDNCHNARLNTNGTCKGTVTCTTGFTTVGDCPDDPSDVRCCIENYGCNENNQVGTCLDTDNASCNGKGFFPGYCPGDDSVQCCFKEDDTDAFVTYLKRVYDLAVAYNSGNPNRLVMEWLRHEKYNGLASGWRLLIGNVDDDWIDFAKDRGLTMMPTFNDPTYCGQYVETDHWGATMNAIYLHPPPSDPGINEGDFGGWGGDLTTFWAEFQVSGEQDAYKFCREKLGKPTINTTFKLLDFIEDADGHNIALELRDTPTKTIYDAVREYYAPGGGYQRRFSSFYLSRFAGDGNQGKIITRNMLVDESNWKIKTLRIAAIVYQAGSVVPVPGSVAIRPETLNDFIDGFISVLRDLTSDVGSPCAV